MSCCLPELAGGIFLRGANVFRELLPSVPPKGGRSPSDDWVLKTPFVGLRSGNDWSTELNEDEVDEDLEVANCCEALWILVSALVLFLSGSFVSLKYKK